MKKYTVNELREMFLSFFESKGHLRLPSFSLVPKNDKSLLIINSGMAPMKPYFTGLEKPPRNRVVTCQKCIRTGDIDNIGHTARHGTFFEMLGNFSFGDYFKKESITWTWEFLTVTIGLDKDRLYPSVYLDDQESWDLWHDYIGIPTERIFKLGKADNFWEHGAGPCGPCSEVYYDRGEKYGCGRPGCTVGCDCDRYMEVWNNVFTQFDTDGKGNYIELDRKNIDTGMGIERLAVVCQDVDSIFEIDTYKELMESISLITHHIYKDDEKADVSLRIIADHIKSSTFMISDGIIPSNEGRGYVLRRLLRRAIRHGRLLGVKKQFLSDLAKVVINSNKSHYTELHEKDSMILSIIKNEEEKFNQTIDQGLEILNQIIAKEKTKIISGEDLFKLYDTFGFPFDLTKEILLDKGFKIDEDGFNKLMNEQKNKARSARKTSNYMGADITVFNELPGDIKSEFAGYDSLTGGGKALILIADNKICDNLSEGTEGIIISDKTTFYPQMGGQAGDIGIITSDDFEFEVYDTIKIMNTKIGHIGKVLNGNLKVGSSINFNVDKINRHSTAINHTATHLLQAALRSVLGKHVEQAGSSVDAERLRFDFTHFKAMDDTEIKKVEKLVNEKILENINVVKKEMSLDEAKAAGAMALFGEKYGSTVRTVKVSDFSFELCGGTHIDNTSEIGCFKIVSESGVASGVRRIEAITSSKILDYYNDLIDKYNEKLDIALNENKNLKKDIESIKKKASNDKASDITPENINGLNVIVDKFDAGDMAGLKNLVDSIKDKVKDYVIVGICESGDSIPCVVAVSDAGKQKGLNAGKILKEVAMVLGGNGGGRDNFAQGQGKDKSKINDAIKLAKSLIK